MIEVSGVLISWETFVIKSVFRRSLLIPASTARFSPFPILLTSSAICLFSLLIFSHGIWYSRSPDAIFCIPFLIRSFSTAHLIRKTAAATSTANARIKNALPKIAISQWTPTNPISRRITFTVIFRFFQNKVHPLTATFKIHLSRLFFQSVFPLIRRTRLKYPIRNRIIVNAAKKEITATSAAVSENV